MTPPWMRLLDPSDRLTLAYNDYLRMDDAQMGAQRRPRRSVTPPPPPTTPSAQAPQANPVVSQSQTSFSQQETQTVSRSPSLDSENSTAWWRRFSLNGSVFNTLVGGGDLNARLALEPNVLPALLNPFCSSGDVSLIYRHPLQSTHLLLGGFYSLRDSGALREVALSGSSSTPPAFHSFGVQLGLEENTWNPRMRVAMGRNSRSGVYGGLGGSTSTWLRASLNLFTGGQASQEHSPLFQISVGNSTPVVTLGVPLYDGTYLQASLSFFNSEARFVPSNSGALVRAGMGSTVPARYESEYVPPVETQIVSLQISLRGSAPDFNQASLTQMDNMEFTRLMISGAVVYYDSACRAVLTREAYEASQLLQTAIARNPRVAVDAERVLKLAGSEILDHTLIMGAAFGSLGANITRNWYRMNDWQQGVSLSLLLGGAALGLGGFAFYHQGENELRVMAPAMIFAPAQLLTLFIPRTSNMARNFTNGGIALIGTIGVLASSPSLVGGDSSAFDWNTASATLFNGAMNSLINTAVDSLINRPNSPSSSGAVRNPATRPTSHRTFTGSVNLNRHGGSLGFGMTF